MLSMACSPQLGHKNIGGAQILGAREKQQIVIQTGIVLVVTGTKPKGIGFNHSLLWFYETTTTTTTTTTIRVASSFASMRSTKCEQLFSLVPGS